MSDTKKITHIWTVEEAPRSSYIGYSNYETFAEAETEARRQAYSNGRDYLVLGTVARAKAPVEINTVQVEKVT